MREKDWNKHLLMCVALTWAALFWVALSARAHAEDAQSASPKDTAAKAAQRDVPATEYPGTWTGQFIWKKDAPGPTRYLMFRKAFELSAAPEQTILRITASGRYRLYVNGQYVGRGPCRSVSPKWMSYDTHDVAARLRAGKNAVTILTFYNSRDLFYRGPAGLFVELEVASADGDRRVIGSDESWKVKDATGYRLDAEFANPQNTPNEIYDAGRDPEDWTAAAYNDSSWESAVLAASPGRQPWQFLEPRMTPMLQEREIFPVKVLEVGEVDPASAAQFKDVQIRDRLRVEKHGPLAVCKADHATELTKPRTAALFQSTGDRDPFILLDFGRPYLAMPRIVFDAPKGTVVETLNCTLLHHGRCIPDGGRLNGDRYVAREGVQTWQHFEHKTPTRYLQVVFRTEGKPVRVESVSLVSLEYPVELRGSFACSDPTLTRLWKAAVDTAYLQLEDTYVMDAARERHVYPPCGEMEQSHKAYYAAYGDIAATDYNFQLGTRDQLPNGQLAWVLGMERPPFTPYYDAFYAQSVLNRHRYFAKRGFLEEHYPALVRQAHWYEGKMNPETFLLDKETKGWRPNWVWLDWPTTKKWDAEFKTISKVDVPKIYFGANALYCKMLMDMAEIAEKMGRSGEARQWNSRAAKVRDSLRRLFWDSERGLYADIVIDGKRLPLFSQLINAMALLYGIATPEQTGPLVREIVAPKADITRASQLYMYYVMEALIQAGAVEDAYCSISEHFAPMLASSDFPTLHEGNGSSIHAGSAGVVWTLMTHVLGIAPLEDGFKRVHIAPQTGQLTWAEGVLPSASGDIRVAWKKEANRFHLEATLPEGVQGELVVPRPNQGPLQLLHNGVKRSVPLPGGKADGVESRDQTVILPILSGNHSVELTVIGSD